MQNVILQHIENLSFILPATEEKIKFCPSLSARNKRTKSSLVLLYIASRELAHGLDREQNKKNATAFLFLAKEPQKGIDERNKVKRSQFLTQKEFQSLGGMQKV